MTGLTKAGWLGLGGAACLAVVLGCPAEKKARSENIPVDTAAKPSTNLADIPSVVPPAEPDTFKPRKLRGTAMSDGSIDVPEAPPPLVAAVEREEAVSRFCYIEFGKKADPSLTGGVAMVVSVGSAGVSDARVGSSTWSGQSGSAVNRCLEDRAKRAWRLAPGVVKPGKYSVRLTFSGR